MKCLLLLFCCCCCFILLAVSKLASGSEQSHLRMRSIHMDEDYNIHEAPKGDNGNPLNVNFSINVRNILGVKEPEQILSMETSLRMYWKDPRVRLRAKEPDEHSDDADSTEFISLNPRVADQFWIPDIFVDRAREIRTPTYYIRPASLRVYPDSTLRYSSRMNFDVACGMDFHKFPVDKQLCEINFESFGHTSKQLAFHWRKDLSTVNPNITLTQFEMKVVLEDTYETDYYDLSYPGVILKVYLSRQIGYHIVQTYIPSIVFVILGWVSLFIAPESVPGRVAMGMTTLLTLIAMFSSVRQNVPKVSYVSYLDIWMVVCIFFVFYCIVEFVVVTVLVRNLKASTARALEYASRTVVPIIFVIFNAVYWPMLYFEE